MESLDLLDSLPDLRAELYRLLRRIPPGRVTTYGDLAEALGDRRASRWVGSELLHHPHGANCPCHRVVRATGELGRFVTGRPAQKRAALQREGVSCGGGRVDLDRFGCGPLEGPQPLRRLRELQQVIRRRITLSDPPCWARVAGLDVSYRDHQGCAAYVEMDPRSRAIVYQCVVGGRIEFPYISTYLAFRELPILRELIQRVRRESTTADVLLVDGSGILHPLRTGVATMVGVVADIPTIGVTKKHLYGQVNLRGMRFGEARDVTEPGGSEVIGAALLPTPTTRRPLFVSPGQQISVSLAVRIVQAWLGHRRLPEPIYWADRFSREAARA